MTPFEIKHIVLIQMFREASSLFQVIGRHPDADKKVRMSRHQGRFEAGNILLAGLDVGRRNLLMGAMHLHSRFGYADIVGNLFV